MSQRSATTVARNANLENVVNLSPAAKRNVAQHSAAAALTAAITTTKTAAQIERTVVAAARNPAAMAKKLKQKHLQPSKFA
ncbi:MAG: hypothetical protein UW09_C0001G0061 [candidate division TM6 bacterium GW2011_GWF2_43_87]|nr:MAG: hypothetical protein UW09_C0001G0061 [candidate division TM6 bacterium GW2011_GWF2_43_87]